MLFRENFIKFKIEVKAAVDQLFKKAFQNQVYETDLLLVLENGMKKEYDEATLKQLNILPYQIGHDTIGFRYNTFYQFINYYRSIVKSREEFSKEFHDYKTKESYLDFYRDFELLLYMKFWETDLILRRLSNLSNLAQGKQYYWEYSQSDFNKRRNLIQDEIQKPLVKICPLFCKLMEEVYCNQIRNAVAHSQYYFLTDTIYFTNKKEYPYYKLNMISYVEWEVKFTKLMLLYNFLIANFNKYRSEYLAKVVDKHFGLLIYFPDKDLKGSTKTGWIKYNIKRDQWEW